MVGPSYLSNVAALPPNFNTRKEILRKAQDGQRTPGLPRRFAPPLKGMLRDRNDGHGLRLPPCLTKVINSPGASTSAIFQLLVNKFFVEGFHFSSHNCHFGFIAYDFLVELF